MRILKVVELKENPSLIVIEYSKKMHVLIAKIAKIIEQYTSVNF